MRGGKSVVFGVFFVYPYAAAMSALRYSLLRIIFMPFVALGFLPSAHSQDASSSRDPVIQSMVQPVFPRWLLEQGISSGSVKLLVEVDSEGKVQDVLIIEARHQAFVDATLSALNHWKFLPRVVEGQNYGYVKPIKLDFDIGQTVINLTTMGFTNHLTRTTDTGKAYDKNAVRMKDLDGIPKPQSMAPPKYTEDLQKLGLEGSVTVEFYIDDAGGVRVPYVAQGTGTQLDLLALDTVRGWRFEPPMSKGKPVLVKASQTFTFKTSTEATAQRQR